MPSTNSHSRKDCVRCGDVGAKIQMPQGRMHGYCLTKAERAARKTTLPSFVPGRKR